MEHGFIISAVVFVILLTAVAVIGVTLFNIAGRFILALDQENAPDILKDNIAMKIVTKICNFACSTEGNLRESGGRYYVMKTHERVWDRNGRLDWYLGSCTSCAEDYCSYTSKEEARTNPKYDKDVTNYLDVLITCVMLVFAGIGGELLYFWFTSHPFSMVTTVTITSVALFIRYISKALWKNIGKTNNLDDRVTKLEKN